MTESEKYKHLYTSPKYQGKDKIWRDDFIKTLEKNKTQFSWDASAILSIISFGYVCGDRTLTKEIHRQPWISSIFSDNSIRLEKIPPHGLYWDSPKEIAKNLKKLLLDEALSICQNKSEIYILLSGGLDSRIVAGIIVELFLQGKLPVKPVSLTWGLENSRDVVYARLVAEKLGIENIQIDLSYQNILENIYASALFLGGLVSPIHLHRMLWFKTLNKNALVVNGSYGDSVGRGEFSKKHILELDYLAPSDPNNLLEKEIQKYAFTGLMMDLGDLRARTPNEPKFVICENEMQGQYMRGLIAHSMSVINQFATVYHMFTAPEVYTYMWKIHPSIRNDKIYSYLLYDINPRLLEIPWARTNKSIMGRTSGARTNLLKDFHKYEDWIRNYIYDDICDILDPGWFKDTGLFNPESIDFFRKEVKKNSCGYRIDLLLWLCSFRIFSEKVKDIQKEDIPLQAMNLTTNVEPVIIEDIKKNKLRIYFRQNVFLYHLVSSIRKKYTKIKTLLIYPPIRKNRIFTE